MSKLDELMALAEEYGNACYHRHEIGVTHVALQDALKAVVEDAERLDWLAAAKLPVYISGSTERIPRTDGTSAYEERFLFEGWVTGIGQDAAPTPRAAIDAARKP